MTFRQIIKNWTDREWEIFDAKHRSPVVPADIVEFERSLTNKINSKRIQDDGSVTTTLRISGNDDIIEDIKELDPPIDISVFPNCLGINLSSIYSESWTYGVDGQLEEITFKLIPCEPSDEDYKFVGKANTQRVMKKNK